MSYRITIVVPDNALAGVVKTLAKYETTVQYIEKSVVVNGNAAPNPTDMYLSLGPATPRKSTIPDRLCMLLERLERDHGVHQVTRKMMNEAMRTKEWTDTHRSTAISMALASKFLVAHTADNPPIEEDE